MATVCSAAQASGGSPRYGARTARARRRTPLPPCGFTHLRSPRPFAPPLTLPLPACGVRSPRRRSSPLPALRGERQGEGPGGLAAGLAMPTKSAERPIWQACGYSLRPSPDLSPLGGERSPRRRSSPLPALRGERQGEGRGDWPQASHYPQYQRSGRFGRPAASHPRPSPGLSPLTRGEGRGGASRPLDLQRLQQGPEMLRVFAPSAARGAVDGLTNLIDARGQHGALGAMKL